MPDTLTYTDQQVQNLDALAHMEDSPFTARLPCCMSPHLLPCDVALIQHQYCKSGQQYVTAVQWSCRQLQEVACQIECAEIGQRLTDLCCLRPTVQQVVSAVQLCEVRCRRRQLLQTALQSTCPLSQWLKTGYPNLWHKYKQAMWTVMMLCCMSARMP